MKFIDTYGATVTGDPETGWTRDGVSIGPCSQEQANTILSGMAPDGWMPPELPPTTIIDSISFIKRFTQQERNSLITFDPMWYVLFATNPINTTDQTLLEELQTAINNDKLTQSRVTQILDLSQASPQ
jgi:hypothetical protein